jgi:hypothetical protein
VIPDVRRPHRDSRERWAAPHASDMKMACISGWKRWRIEELPDHVNRSSMILSFIPVGPPLAAHPTGHRVDLTRQVRGEFLRLPKYCNVSILHHVLSIIRPPINARGTWQQLASRVYFYIHMYSSQHTTMDDMHPGTALNQRARDARCPISVPCRYATARAQCWHCMAWHEVADTDPQRERSRQYCSDAWVLLL